MHPLDTKGYLLKRYSPSDSFWTFFPESFPTSDSIYDILFWSKSNSHFQEIFVMKTFPESSTTS